MSVDKHVSISFVERELDEAKPFAGIHGWRITWDSETLTLQVMMKSSVDQAEYCLKAQFLDYRQMPARWEFVDPKTGQGGAKRFYPKGSSYFHEAKPSLCAEWNRLAHHDMGGPHGDWNPGHWEKARPNHNRVGDILVLIQQEMNNKQKYKGRMG